MTFVLPIHVLATIIWLGGLFLLSVVFAPSARRLDQAPALFMWHNVLSRFFILAWICMALILVTGIALVFLAFGGFSGVPIIHRVNSAIGIPAIILYGYLYFVPWRRFRRAMWNNDLNAAEKSLGQARLLMAIIVSLGLVASVVSVAARYYL